MSKDKFIFAAIFLFARAALSFGYVANCEKGILKEFQSDLRELNQEESCKQYLRNGFARCFDSRKPNVSSRQLTISTPTDNYYKNRESPSYSKDEITKIINWAVETDNDPYMALAIVILENPPLIKSQEQLNLNKLKGDYSVAYGTIPLDDIAVADVLGCKRGMIPDAYGSSSRMAFIGAKNIRNLSLDHSNQLSDWCMLDPYQVGKSAQFTHGRETPSKNLNPCCVRVEIDTKNGDAEYLAREQKLRDSISALYLKHLLDSAAKSRLSGVTSPSEKLAMLAQAYNGYGKLGVTEKLRNSCLDKMDFSQTPLYVAGVSEIMMNSLMSNSEIQDLVKNAEKNQKKVSPSMLCKVYGDGSNRIDGLDFVSALLAPPYFPI